MIRTRATIAHISDLHFGGGMDSESLRDLTSLVREQKPDYVVVSGDLVESPWPWSVARARRFVDDLASACRLTPERVLTVPGNHDYKIKGIWGFRRLTRVPYHVYFRDEGLQKRLPARWCAYVKLALNALWPGGRSLCDRLEVRVDDERGLVLFGVNSNPLFEMLATGRVDGGQIQELSRWAREHPDTSAYFKVVVVHHHPVPVAYVSTDLGGRIEESFMTFYNAGAFLREIGRSGVRLVLHGHKHFSGFTRVAYDLPHIGRNELGVLAAGAAAHRHPSDPLGNGFNVVRVREDDTVQIEQWYYSRDVRRKDESRIFEFIGLDDVRAARNRQPERRLRIRHMEKIANLTRDGYTDISITLRDCRVRAGDGMDSIEFGYLTVPRPAYIRDLQVLPSTTLPLAGIDLEENETHLRQFKGRFRFGGTLTREHGPFTVAYGYRLMNGHALSHPELRRKYPSVQSDWEYVTLDCDEATELILLRAEFPANYDMDQITDYDAVALHRPAPCGNEQASVEHDDETARIRNTVRRTGTALELEVPAPVPEFAYRIRWRYERAHIAHSSFRREAELRFVRRALIDAARIVARGGTDRRHAQATELLGLFQDAVLVPYNPIDPREQVDVSLAVLDDEGNLRFVATTFGRLADLFPETLLPGEGCAGFSFEKGRVLFYSRATDSIRYYVSPDEIARERGAACALTSHETLVTIPWMDPGSTPMGVFSVGSSSGASRLLGMFDLDERAQEDEAARLRLLTQTYQAGIISLLTS